MVEKNHIASKNLKPANLENDLKQTRYVSQAVMHGDRRPFPTMLITLDEEEIVLDELTKRGVI